MLVVQLLHAHYYNHCFDAHCWSDLFVCYQYKVKPSLWGFSLSVSFRSEQHQNEPKSAKINLFGLSLFYTSFTCSSPIVECILFYFNSIDCLVIEPEHCYIGAFSCFSKMSLLVEPGMFSTAEAVLSLFVPRRIWYESYTKRYDFLHST